MTHPRPMSGQRNPDGFARVAPRVQHGALRMCAIVLGVALFSLGPAADAQVVAPATSAATSDTAASTTERAANDQRLKKLSEELRCLVCQNQTLADSNADLANDLRNEVRGQIDAGRSDDEIKAYLVQRYGDFVLYRPPVQSNTWLLWFGPFALLVVGAFAWYRIGRTGRRHGSSATTVQAPIRNEATPDAVARARRLLDD